MKVMVHSLLSICFTGLMLGISIDSQAQARAGSQANTQIINLAPQSQRALQLPQAPNRIAISNPEVIDAAVLADPKGGSAEVLLTGLKPGASDLHIWVNGSNQPKRWQIKVEGPLAQVLEQKGYLPEAEIDAIGDTTLISGHSNSLLSHQQAHEIALSSSGSPENVTDISTVGNTGMVQIDVKIAELSSSVLKEIGIDWRGNNTGGNWDFSSPGNIVSNGFNIIFGGSKNFSARLALLQKNGLARSLAEPTLVALSGQSASFLSGGAIPVLSSGGLGTQNVEYKEFGIGLTVSPTILSNDRIALKVAPESSDLDYSNALQTENTLIPALRLRKTDTFVELGDGESFIISGLVSRNTMANVEKMPILGDLPIIGAFFRNMKYTQEERELVIIVTPHLVRPISAGTTLPLPGEGREMPETRTNAWGAYLIGEPIGQSLPGFSY